MRILIDRFIELLKWPAAVYMLLSLPAYIRSLYAFNFMSWHYVALAGGVAVIGRAPGHPQQYPDYRPRVHACLFCPVDFSQGYPHPY